MSEEEGRDRGQAEEQPERPRELDAAAFADPSGPPSEPEPARTGGPVQPAATNGHPALTPVPFPVPPQFLPPALPSYGPPPVFAPRPVYQATPGYPAANPAFYPAMHPAYRTGAYLYPFPPPVAQKPKKSKTGLVIAGLVGLVGVTGLTLGALTYDNNRPAQVANSSSTVDGTVTQAAMCQTIAAASNGTGPGSIPTMPGGEQDLSAMQAAEAQVYQWAQQTQDGALKDELEQENSDAQQFITDYNEDPDDDTVTPTGVLSVDMSIFTIDQSKVDATCGISTGTAPGGSGAENA